MVGRRRHPMFKGRHFDQEIIILCVRWYVTYKLSYRDLSAMMLERGIRVAPSTIFRWVQRYVLEFEKSWNRFSRPVGCSWRVDETYILVKGQWCYLYRAVDKRGRTVDFLLREDRGIDPPRKVTLDGYWHPAWRGVHVRKCAYLNNVVEQDHRAIKARCGTMRGFKSSQQSRPPL
jgi:transposase-like protein